MAEFFLYLPLFIILGSQVQDNVKQQGPALENIRDFHRISDRLSSSGQVSPEETSLLKEQGFEIVINLAPADENWNEFESFIIVQLGLTYVHIPVSWEDPSIRDLKFTRFLSHIKLTAEGSPPVSIGSSSVSGSVPSNHPLFPRLGFHSEDTPTRGIIS